jgi:hypothetical protein
MRGLACGLVAACLVAGLPRAAEPQTLPEARALYNEGDYEGAVAAALTARLAADAADAAELVRARALLELFRGYGDPEYLVQARMAFAGIDATALAGRDRTDLLVGLGQSLFLADQPGPAAEIFDSALGGPSELTRADRLQLLDWWASAVDREAQGRPVDRRVRPYQRLADRMEEELQADPGNPAANYWLPVAARGSGDIDRAWHAAVAGWIRAGLDPPTAERVRADLDRLVIDALVTERARSTPAAERPDVRAALRAEWERVKGQWPTAGPPPP